MSTILKIQNALIKDNNVHGFMKNFGTKKAIKVFGFKVINEFLSNVIDAQGIEYAGKTYGPNGVKHYLEVKKANEAEEAKALNNSSNATVTPEATVPAEEGRNLIIEATNNATNTTQEFASNATEFAGNVVSNATEAASAAKNVTGEAVSNTTSAVQDAIVNGTQKANETITNATANAADAIENAVSPSPEAEELPSPTVSPSPEATVTPEVDEAELAGSTPIAKVGHI